MLSEPTDQRAPSQESEPGVDENTVGFNVPKENLHCLLALNDGLAPHLSEIAGEAFWRAFIVQNRSTGEVWAKMRFRYTNGDSWAHIHLKPEEQEWSVKKRVESLAAGLEAMIWGAVMTVSGGVCPSLDTVTRYYPPEPDDARKTFEWLIAQDLVKAEP